MPKKKYRKDLLIGLLKERRKIIGKARKKALALAGIKPTLKVKKKAGHKKVKAKTKTIRVVGPKIRGKGPEKKYSKELLIGLMKERYKTTGKMPKESDFAKLKKYPHPSTYITYFGSWKKALIAAGIIRAKKKPKKITKTRIIRPKPKIIVRKAKPKVIVKTRTKTIVKPKLVGIKIKNKGPEKKYSKELLIGLMKERYKTTGKKPIESDFTKLKKYPNPSTYINYFGSWRNALIAARIIRIKKRLKPKIITKTIIKTRTVKSKPKIIVRKTKPKVIVKTRTKTIVKPKLVGIKIKSKGPEKKYSKEFLIGLLKERHKVTSKIPTKAEFEKLKSYPRPATYIEYFGSWKRALIAAGLVKPRKVKKKAKPRVQKKVKRRKPLKQMEKYAIRHQY